MYRYVSRSAFLSLFLSLSVSVSGYIIGILHVCEQTGPARPVCNTQKIVKKERKEKKKKKRELILRVYVLYLYFFLFRAECLCQFSDILWLIVCTYTSLCCVCFSISVWISVVVIGYIITHSMCLCPTLDRCFFLSLTLSVPITVFGYIVTDCSSIGISHNRLIPLLFSSLSLSQCTGYYR